MIQLTITLAVALVVLWMALPKDELVPAIAREDCYFSDYKSEMGLAQCARWEPRPRITLLWSAQQGAVGYRVSGSIDYWFLACDEDPPFGPTERYEFEDVLGRNATEYTLPLAMDNRTTTVKEYTFSVQALGDGGDILAGDGRALITEPPWACWEPEEGAQGAAASPFPGGAT